MLQPGAKVLQPGAKVNFDTSILKTQLFECMDSSSCQPGVTTKCGLYQTELKLIISNVKEDIWLTNVLTDLSSLLKFGRPPSLSLL